MMQPLQPRRVCNRRTWAAHGCPAVRECSRTCSTQCKKRHTKRGYTNTGPYLWDYHGGSEPAFTFCNPMSTGTPVWIFKEKPNKVDAFAHENCMRRAHLVDHNDIEEGQVVAAFFWPQPYFCVPTSAGWLVDCGVDLQYCRVCLANHALEA
jgi:hypothetical protein